MDALADAMGNGSKTCSWLVACPYGRPQELQTIVAAAMQWYEQYVGQLAVGY